MNNQLNNKRILVTGCAGTVGSHLLAQLVNNKHKPSEVIGIDNNESTLFFLEQEYLSNNNVRFFLADIRDVNVLRKLTEGIDIVLHCAGYKHVLMCERSPFDAVQTNIHGVQNIIEAAIKNNVNKVLYTSTDKAVNPTNVMGTSKLMGERLITAANSTSRGEGTIFSSTRFGNVLGSRGSVIPIFIEQIKRGGPVTVTDEKMTRFIMSIDESAHLVLDSVNLMCGGEVFITKMPVVYINDLADVMIGQLAPEFGHDPSMIKKEFIGVKPGEKLFEELMTSEETRRAIELEHYFAITPAFKGMYRQINYEYPGTITKNVDKPYISVDGPFMNKEEIRTFLRNNDLLSIAPSHQPYERYWPGDKENPNS
jgi:FlaA1/EpsC-like NDP-sugar epimerase